jgi:hypothetical protein
VHVQRGGGPARARDLDDAEDAAGLGARELDLRELMEEPVVSRDLLC